MKGCFVFLSFLISPPGRIVRKEIVLISHVSTNFEWQECSLFSICICFSLYIANISVTFDGMSGAVHLGRGLGGFRGS